MGFTKEQQDAIYTSGRNLLVTAAAGSGKTAVLVERIINKILNENIDIDSLVVMTFTKAAAAEMRERIYKAIVRQLSENPSNTHLHKQLSLLGLANITTIHSFCTNIVRNYFYAIDIDPNFRVADETEAELLKLEALAETLDEMFEGEDSGVFSELYEGYGKGSDKMFSELLLSLYEFAMSTPFPGDWLNAKLYDLKSQTVKEFDDTVWALLLKQDIALKTSGFEKAFKRAIDLAKQDESVAGYVPQLTDEFQDMKKLSACAAMSWDALSAAFDSITFAPLRGAKKGADEALKKQIQAIRNDVKDEIKMLKTSLFSASPYSYMNTISYTVPLMECLCKSVLLLDKKFSEKKREKLLLDFNDLEHMCINIITTKTKEGDILPSEIGLALRNRYNEILVDEYQDSNEVQEVIFSTLSNGQNLFVVGDIKQSIYRFRHTNPMLFKNKRDFYQPDENALHMKVTLSKNFRSRDLVLEGINHIFKKIMSEKIGELDYDENECLYPGLIFPDPSHPADYQPELHIVETKLPEPDEDDLEPALSISAAELEASVIAKRIVSLIEEKYPVFDKQTQCLRPVCYKDIAILMRSTTGSDIFAKTLSESGIPVYLDAGGKYFVTTEIATIMSMLEVIDNPYQDIPLLSVLRSPLFGFNPSELVEIRIAAKDACLYDAVLERADTGDALSKKIERFLGMLLEWRKKSKYQSVDVLLDDILTQTGYFVFCGALKGGEVRQANLSLLLDRAKQFEQTSFKGLFHFINFVAKLRKSKGDFGSAKVLSEHQNVVRIMSIHKSKGLEFPVVFVSGLGKRFNRIDLSKPILFHETFGFAPEFIDINRRISCPTIAKHALKAKLKYESLSEEIRILYVALTRAKEKLILTGTVSDIAARINKWEQLASNGEVPPSSVIAASGFLDLIGMTLAQNPDLKGLGGSADYEYESGPSPSWRIYASYAGRALPYQTKTDLEKPLLIFGSTVSDAIRSRFEYAYPYRASSSLPQKLTVTEIKRLAADTADEYAKPIFTPGIKPAPSFIRDPGILDAAQRGLMIHAIMQHIALTPVMDDTVISRQIEGIAIKLALNETQVTQEVIQKITRFFKSDTGRLMLKYTDSVKRETPFILEVAAKDIYPATGEDFHGDTVLVQGIIDCYFKTEDGIVLIDYKTDRIKNSINELTDKYRTQLEYYQRALSAICTLPVIKTVIYSFDADKEIEF